MKNSGYKSTKNSFYLHTNCQIIVELVSVRTTTFITANCINTSVVAARRSTTFVFIYALVMINVLDKSVWASTTVCAHKILKITIPSCVNNSFFAACLSFLKTKDQKLNSYLATVFTIRIIDTFIVICTESSWMIQFETSWANTLKTSKSVNTFARFWANAWLVTFVYIWKKNTL